MLFLVPYTFPFPRKHALFIFICQKFNLSCNILNYRYIGKLGELSQTTERSHLFSSCFRKKLCPVKVVWVKVQSQHSERVYNWKILLMTRASGVPMIPQRRKGGKCIFSVRAAISSSSGLFSEMTFRSQCAVNKC